MKTYVVDKMRHQDSHKMRHHQLGVKIEGWQCLDPVTVDKVGVYFRDAPAEIHSRVSFNSYLVIRELQKIIT